MGESKHKKIVSFPKAQINDWEYDYCVNFAIALARMTGWLLHVDYWVDRVNFPENIPESEITPLRVYVGDDMDNIFDVKGVKKIQEFNQNTILPIAKKKAKSNGSVLTRYYSEERLWELPLRIMPDEKKIEKAVATIRSNAKFLDGIYIRQKPFIPAHLAAKFTYGWCAPYAEALHDLKKVPAAALIAIKYTPQFARSILGYIHSFVLHPDGNAEDSWGKQKIERIAERFGLVEFEIREIEHQQAIKSQKEGSPDKYLDVYKEAEQAIIKYYMS